MSAALGPRPGLRPDEPGGAQAPDPAEIRPIPILVAIAWAGGTTAAFVTLVVLVDLLSPATHGVLEVGFACQAATYLSAIAVIHLVYARRASIRELLALRGARPPFHALAMLLGAAVALPADALYNAILQRFPMPDRVDPIVRAFGEASPARRVILALIVVLLGPLVEELFFRGALFRTLLARAGPLAVVTTVALTAALFALAHGQWQTFLPIGLLGLVLGYLRHASGSIVPPLLMHGTFNALPLLALSASPRADAAERASPPLWLLAACVIVLFVLLDLVRRAAPRREALHG
jgi:membrane protease YdiL (CAAX protease family)